MIYVTIETFGGMIHEVNAYHQKKDASQEKRKFLKYYNIKTVEDRQYRSDSGIEFHIYELEVK